MYHEGAAIMAESVSTVPHSTELADRLLAEGLLSMSAVARLLGELKGGRPVHPSTPYRWATRGIRLSNGSRLRLEAMVLSGKPVTSRAALVRFLVAQQPDDCHDTPDAPPRSPRARNKAAEKAGHELERLGL
jgi:hypothetical protein